MDPTDLSADAEARLAEHIRAERIHFVFIQSTLPIIFSPLAGVVGSRTSCSTSATAPSNTLDALVARG